MITVMTLSIRTDRSGQTVHTKIRLLLKEQFVQGLHRLQLIMHHFDVLLYGPRQANLVLIAYASSEGSGEPAHPRSLARTFAARS